MPPMCFVVIEFNKRNVTSQFSRRKNQNLLPLSSNQNAGPAYTS
jgi:hypothetical protein